MKLNYRMHNVWWIGVTLVLLLGCSLPKILIPTPVSPTLTPIPPTVPPASPTTTNIQVEQARAFAEPILQAITNREPDFVDDFSTAGNGWVGGNLEQNELAVVQNGVARLEVLEKDVVFENQALNRKDFVLQVDARIAAGDPSTNVGLHFHNRSSANWYYLSMNIASLNWNVDKRLNDQQINIARGQGNLSPVGKMTNIIIVASGTEAAIYLNNAPVAYFNDPDFNISGYTILFCASSLQGVCEFDNIKFWELANVTGSP